MMHRSAKDGARSSRHSGGEGVLILPSNQGVCERHGTEDLLSETSTAPAHIPHLASEIAQKVGGFPYYIHHVVDQPDQLRREPK